MIKPDFVNWVIILAHRYVIVHYTKPYSGYPELVIVDTVNDKGWYLPVYYKHYDIDGMLHSIKEGIKIGWHVSTRDFGLSRQCKQILLDYVYKIAKALYE